MYGTRDAAANFQYEVKRLMIKSGFAVSRYNPSIYWHAKKDLKCLVHGDDFVTVGERKEMQWFRQVLESRFEMKTKVVGSGGGEERCT